MSRPRAKGNKDLPTNLYRNKRNGVNYYQYRRPDNHKRIGLGSDKETAIENANQANAMLMCSEDMLDRIIAAEPNMPKRHSTSLFQLVDLYIEERTPKKKWGDATRKNNLGYLKRYQREFGDQSISSITTYFLSQWFKSLTDNALVKHRTLLADLFSFAVSEGYRKDNPVTDTQRPVISKADKSRKRLSWDWYMAIYNLADEWVQDAMDLALITSLRRGDIVRLKLADIVDGKLQVKTKKTGVAIRFPITGQLEAILRRIRSRSLLSPFLIRYAPKTRVRKHLDAKEHWTQVTDDHLTKTFAKLRDKVPEIHALPSAQRPTFHEVRSLSGHLYEARGDDKKVIQARYGHTTLKMTEGYLDDHQIKWSEVDADLQLPHLNH